VILKKNILQANMRKKNNSCTRPSSQKISHAHKVCWKKTF